MLRDASQKQVIQKFSFIENLELPPKVKRENERVLEPVDADEAFNFVPQVSSKSSPSTNKLDPEDSALLARVNHANLSDKSHLATGAFYPGIAEIVKYSELHPSTNYQPKKANYLGKILFALSCGYAVFGLWWLFGYRASKLVTHLMGGRHLTLSQSEVEFIEYMERSLVALDRELEAKESDSGDQDKVVYVPVYTPQDRTPNLPAPTTVAPSQPKAPAVSPTTPQTLKIPAPPPLPAPATIPENSASRPSQETAAVANPVKYTLTGILELGAGQSAALIKVNGQTRRFWLGEQIGDSGWILESIDNQTAKINHQGQVRSIAVGESF